MCKVSSGTNVTAVQLDASFVTFLCFRAMFQLHRREVCMLLASIEGITDGMHRMKVLATSCFFAQYRTCGCTKK